MYQNFIFPKPTKNPSLIIGQLFYSVYCKGSIILEKKINFFVNLLNTINSFNIVKWFYMEVSGVVIDLLLFFTLVSLLGIPVYPSNLASSGTAVTFIYLTSGKYVFKDSIYSVRGYVVFISYYAVSINLFSFLISTLSQEFSLHPLVAKIVTLPVSFFVNYFFASQIIQTKI